MTRVAVVGAGVAGLTCAYLLNRAGHDVVLIEAEPRLGGHAHTHDVTDPDGAQHRIDSGFIVHNDVTYPVLRRLFAELGVPVQPTQMSMSIRCGGCGLAYAGGRGAAGLLARPAGLLDRRFLALLAAVPRFHRLARATLDAADGTETQPETFGHWLVQRHFSPYFVQHYAVPLVACVWSSGHESALDYPAAYLFAFLAHHGMLSVSGSHQWATVVGGSRTYVDRLAATLPQVRVGSPAVAVTRASGARVRTADGSEVDADAVVLATHADTALSLLEDPTPAEREVLGAFVYSTNETVLHTDPALLPGRRVRSSWNFTRAACDSQAQRPVVTYWMDRLHGLPEDGTPHLVTLNATDRIDPGRRIATMTYRHPLYTPAAVLAQRRLPELTTATTAFAGAYHGWGFHEDGARAGAAAATAFGGGW